MTDISNINSRIRAARKKLKLKQVKMAESVGVSQGYWSDLEGNKGTPSDTLLIAIAYRWAINLHWLLTGEGEMHILRAPEDGTSDSLLIEKTNRLAAINQKGTTEERAQIFGLIDAVHSDIIRRETEEATKKLEPKEDSPFQQEKERKQKPA